MGHMPVLAVESVDLLLVNPAGLYIDGTVGLGGHSKRIVSKLSDNGLLWGFDWDEEMLNHARQTLLPESSRVEFFREGFSCIGQHLAAREMVADGILLDLGLNSKVLDDPSRGFLYRDPSAELDMRMDRSRPRTAAMLLASGGEEELERVFREYGEVRKPKTVARAIVHARRIGPIVCAKDLIEALRRAHALAGGPAELSRIWQALRYEVNEEMAELSRFVQEVHDWIRPGGRVCVISYESISDRMIKSLHRRVGDKESRFRLLTRRVVVPGREEIRSNPRARSAKLRAMERTA
jgi:16S rRNA (cytosine1402-N4)-methyltransferase